MSEFATALDDAALDYLEHHETSFEFRDGAEWAAKHFQEAKPHMLLRSSTNGKARPDDETAALLAAYLGAEGALGQAEAVLAACIIAEAQAGDARRSQETAVFHLQADADQARSALRVALARARAERR